MKSGVPAFDGDFGEPFFQYMSANPDRWRIYDVAMTGVHDSETIPVLDAYDFDPFRTIVDVGGGNGMAMAAILRRHPGARGVVFDLPDVVKRAAEGYARTGVSDRCRFVVVGRFLRIGPGVGRCVPPAPRHPRLGRPRGRRDPR